MIIFVADPYPIKDQRPMTVNCQSKSVKIHKKEHQKKCCRKSLLFVHTGENAALVAHFANSAKRKQFWNNSLAIYT